MGKIEINNKWAPPSNVQRCCLRKFGASGLPAFDNSLCSYLQVSFFRSARPPKQLEFTEFWVLEPEHGQGWTIQQLIPFSNFGVAWERASLGSGCPLSSKLDAKKDCTDGMAGATGTESLTCRCEAASRYHVTHASGISKIPRLPQASMSFSCKAPAYRSQQLLLVLKFCHDSRQRCPGWMLTGSLRDFQSPI